ncbi:hypothetical protein KC930_00780 [Candidatus Saccharibacteria bacterium]|nr:hypothetical protein [Candidatus Saccharibacteria bacterium]
MPPKTTYEILAEEFPPNCISNEGPCYKFALWLLQYASDVDAKRITLEKARQLLSPVVEKVQDCPGQKPDEDPGCFGSGSRCGLEDRDIVIN